MDLNQFKANMRNGGARTNLFEIIITNPVNGTADLLIPFRAKGSSLPASNITPIELPYHGRIIKVAGHKTYEDWSVTVMDDEDHALRNAFESWSNSINTPESNTRALGTSDITAYKSTAIVNHLSQTGAVLRTYKLVGVFPVSISSVALDWSNDAITEFEVNFAVDYFLVEPGATGDAGPV